MRLHKKLIAGATAALLALGLAACEVDPEAMEDFDEPDLEEGDTDL